jgi:hypothetical protein
MSRGHMMHSRIAWYWGREYKCRYHQTDDYKYKDDKSNALYAVEKGKVNEQSDGSNADEKSGGKATGKSA